MKKFFVTSLMLLLISPCLLFFACSKSTNDNNDGKTQYEVTINSYSNGTITGYGSFEFNENCNLVASPDSGYYLDYWEMNGIKYYGNKLSFKVTKDTHLQVEFKKGECFYLQENTNKRLIAVNGTIEETTYSLKIKASSETFSYWWTDNSNEPISFSDEYSISKSSISSEKVYTAENTLVGAFLGFTGYEHKKNTLTTGEYTSLSNCNNLLELTGYYYFDGSKLNCNVSKLNNKTEVEFTLDCSQLSSTHYELFGKIFIKNNVKYVMLYMPTEHPDSLGLSSHTYEFANNTTYTIKYC